MLVARLQVAGTAGEAFLVILKDVSIESHDLRIVLLRLIEAPDRLDKKVRRGLQFPTFLAGIFGVSANTDGRVPGVLITA